jgi:hypothetical protein
MRGGRLETSLALGFLFAVVMNAQLLLPNPYMPEAVRHAHLIETASSNFILGCFVGWLLTPSGGIGEVGGAHALSSSASVESAN